jgi:hypothetical protein
MHRAQACVKDAYEGEAEAIGEAWNPVKRGDFYKNEWKRATDAWGEKAERKAEAAIQLWTDRMGWGTEGGKRLVGTRRCGMLSRFEDMISAPPSSFVS